jgi:subtilisin family serine protease
VNDRFLWRNTKRQVDVISVKTIINRIFLLEQNMYFYTKNMRTFLFFIFFGSFLGLQAQDKYWVYLVDKDTVGFNPYRFFDEKAIERRNIMGLSLYDFSDIPVDKSYVEALRSFSDTVLYASRWFNAVCLKADNDQIEAIRALPFVVSVELATSGYFILASQNEIDSENNYIDSLLLFKQLDIMQGSLFRDNGFTGKGIRIAIFDGGFPNVDVLPCFSYIRDNKRIIKTWDFARNKENVYDYNSHGTIVMCCIAGINDDGTPFGLATDAEFLLARTEVNPEPFSEEENWVAALEWADQNGADIVNSSLGYTNNRYFPFDMDGKTSFVTRGANMAVSKGILVVNAAGNDGDSKWRIIGAPADADSILSVGGVDPFSEYHINFSSFGPTADGRLKPDVCAAGEAFAYGKNKTGVHYGTSFASPLTAGFAACAMQASPEVKGYEMLLKMRESGHLYPYYDYAHGYGIPQASFFAGHKPEFIDTEIQIDNNSGMLTVWVQPIDSTGGRNNLCYIHCSDGDGKLLWYKVFKVYDNTVFEESIPDFEKGTILRVHYRGITKTYSF